MARGERVAGLLALLDSVNRAPASAPDVPPGQAPEAQPGTVAAVKELAAKQRGEMTLNERVKMQRVVSELQQQQDNRRRAATEMPGVRTEGTPLDLVSDEVKQLEWAAREAAADRDWGGLVAVRRQVERLRLEALEHARRLPISELTAKEREEQFRRMLKRLPTSYLDAACTERAERLQRVSLFED